jgi:hypothetical protein
MKDRPSSTTEGELTSLHMRLMAGKFKLSTSFFKVVGPVRSKVRRNSPDWQGI